MKYLKVEMTVAVKDDKDVDVIKKWEHHIDYAIDMDSYPEIDHIENVVVTDNHDQNKIEDNMERKYELVKEDSIEFNGITLYRIKALKDFDTVKAGQLGGYIEKEENLNHYGTAWVSDNAQVSGDARVSGDTWISGDARVYGSAQVSDDARVYGSAHVSDNAQIFGNAQIFDNAWVSGNAHVSGDARVSGSAKILKDANIRESSDCIVVGHMGSRNDHTTFYMSKTGEIMVSCGCFNGTIDEFIRAVNDTHKDNEKYRKQYLYAVEYIKNIKLGGNYYE